MEVAVGREKDADAAQRKVVHLTFHVFLEAHRRAQLPSDPYAVVLALLLVEDVLRVGEHIVGDAVLAAMMHQLTVEAGADAVEQGMATDGLFLQQALMPGFGREFVQYQALTIREHGQHGRGVGIGFVIAHQRGDEGAPFHQSLEHVGDPGVSLDAAVVLMRTGHAW